MKTIRHILIGLCSLLTFLPALTSCDNDDDALSPTQGVVCFQFTKTTTYTLTDLSDIYSLIVTLEKDGKRFNLPSQILSGNADVISTPAIALEAGTYKVAAYKAFDYNGDLIELLDIKLESDNELVVRAGTPTAFVMPVAIKTPVSINNYYNILYGLCREVLGEDKSLWPASWDFEGGVIDESWNGLEFELDDYGNIGYIKGLVIDGNPSYNTNKDGELVDRSLTEFKHMKKLPGFIANLSSLSHLSIRNCDLEELPEELKNSAIQTLYIENTQISDLPAGIGEIATLINVCLKGNRLTAFPEALTRLTDLYDLNIIDEQIDELPDDIRHCTSLRNLRINGTNITALPDVFNDLYKISTLDLRNNKKLTSLPPSLKELKVPYDEGLFTKKSLRAVLLDGCAFTRIPEEVQHADIFTLSMADNRISSVSTAEIERMPDLGTLILDRNPLSTFPRLTSSKLGMLSLIGCGFTREDIDVSGLSALSPDYLFLTQDDYDRVVGKNWFYPAP